MKTYFSIARVSRKVKENLNGIDFADKGSVRFPFNAGLYAAKADLYRREKNYESAVKEYNLALKNDACSSEYYAARAEIKFLQEDFQGAVSDYSYALKFSHDNHNLYARRAFCFFCLKKYSLAAQDYNKASEQAPAKTHYKYMFEASKKLR